MYNVTLLHLKLYVYTYICIFSLNVDNVQIVNTPVIYAIDEMNLVTFMKDSSFKLT